MGNHKWKEIVTHKDTTVRAIEVKADLDIKASGRGTSLSARNEALRSAEQQVINEYKNNGHKLLNDINAASGNNTEIWKKRHSVSYNSKSSHLALKGGKRVNSFVGVWDGYSLYMDIRKSQYDYAPYYMQDQGGIFTIRESKGGWFSGTTYLKIYRGGPLEGKEYNISKEEYRFWANEGKALWGYLDFWGNFVPGLLNPELESGIMI